MSRLPKDHNNLYTRQWQAIFERAIEQAVSYQKLAACLGRSIPEIFECWADGSPITPAEVDTLNRLLPGIWKELNGILDHYLAADEVVPVVVTPEPEKKKIKPQSKLKKKYRQKKKALPQTKRVLP